MNTSTPKTTIYPKSPAVGNTDIVTVQTPDSAANYSNIYIPAPLPTTAELANADKIPPAVDYTATAASNVALTPTAVLPIIFNEAVQLGSGVITLRNAADNSVIETFKNGAGSAGGSLFIYGQQLAINPAVDLQQNTAYKLTFAANAIKDLAGNALPAISDANAIQLKTLGPDTQAPVIQQSTANENAVASVNFYFNEAVKLGGGKIEVHKVADNSLVDTFIAGIDTEGLFASATGSKVSLPLSSALQPKTAYYLTFSEDAFTDFADNASQALTDPSKITFTTAIGLYSQLNGSISKAPILTNISLSDQVNPASSINFYFDKDVRLGTGMIALHKLSDNSVVESFVHGEGSHGGGISASQYYWNINPGVSLPLDESFYLTFDQNAAVDSTGTAYIAPKDPVALSFAGPHSDHQAPLLTYNYAQPFLMNALSGTTIYMSFDESVKFGAGSIVLHNADGSVVESFTQGVGSLEGYATTTYGSVNLTTFAKLTPGANYYVTLDGNAISDKFGNAFAGVNNASTIQFTQQVANPTSNINVSNSSTELGIYAPGNDNQIGLARDSNIFINFNQAIKLGQGAVVLHNADTGTIVETFKNGVGSAGGNLSVDWSGNTVVIDPGADYAPATQYYVTMEAGAVTDANGKVYAGFSDLDTLNFFSAGLDQLAPQMTGISPNDNSVGIDLNAALAVYFDEEVIFGQGEIVLHKADGSVVERFSQGVGSAGGSEVANYTWVNIQPGKPLQPNSQYYLTVDKQAIYDKAGHAFGGFTDPSKFNFSSAGPDHLAPQLSWVNLQNLPVDSNLELSFSEAMQLGSGAIELHKADGSLVEAYVHGVGSKGGTVSTKNPGGYPGSVSINPQDNLLPETKYYLTIANDALTDTAGNAFTVNANTPNLSFYSFSPGPQFYGIYSNANNAANGNWILNFDNPIKLGAGSIAIHNAADNSVVEVFTHGIGNAGGKASIRDNTVILDPHSSLANNSSYYLTITPDAISDAKGAAFVGINDTTIARFNTGLQDSLAPQLMSSNPVDNQTHIASNSDFTLYFNEAVVLGEGAIVLHNADGSVRESFSAGLGSAGGNVINAYVYGDSNLLINPGQDLQLGQGYYFTIDQHAIMDVAGNYFAGIADASSLNFKIATDPALAFPVTNYYIGGPQSNLTIDDASSGTAIGLVGVADSPVY